MRKLRAEMDLIQNNVGTESHDVKSGHCCFQTRPLRVKTGEYPMGTGPYSAQEFSVADEQRWLSQAARALGRGDCDHANEQRLARFQSEAGQALPAPRE